MTLNIHPLPSPEGRADGLPRPLQAGATRPFQSWHYAMLNDHQRNQAIRDAIEELDLDGRTVVEIGAGTGIISILFARAGARRVIACEMNQAMAKVAMETIRRAGLGERITILPLSSTMALDQGILPNEPDVIFTETVDCGVIGEGYHAIARDIRRMAGENTIVLPNEIRQYGVIISSAAIHGLNHVEDVFGIDMAPLNAWSTRTYFPVRAEYHGFEMLSRPRLVRTYDYLEDIPAAPVSMQITNPGTAHGLLTWFELRMGNHATTNAPGTNSHWHQAFHPLPRPLELKKGEVISLHLDDQGMVNLG